MVRITKENIIMDVLMMDRVQLLFLLSTACIASVVLLLQESIEDACTVHGIDTNKLVEDLNAYFAAR